MISIITRIQIEGNDTVSFQNGTNYVQSMSQIMPQIPTYISYGYDSITITQGVAKPFQFSIYQITQVGGNSFTALNFQDSADVVQQRTIDVYTLLVTVVFKGCCECGSTEPECSIQYTYGNSGLTGEFDYTYGTPGLIRFNDITGNNQDFSGFFPLIPDGSWVFLFSKTDPTVYAVLQLSNYINAGGAAAFDAIELNANGTPFVEGTQFCVDFTSVGGSLVQGWQDTLNINPNLNQDNTIDGGGFDFVFDNNNSFTINGPGGSFEVAAFGPAMNAGTQQILVTAGYIDINTPLIGSASPGDVLTLTASGHIEYAPPPVSNVYTVANGLHYQESPVDPNVFHLGGNLIEDTTIYNQGFDLTVERAVSGYALKVENTGTSIGPFNHAIRAVTTDGLAGDFYAGADFYAIDEIEPVVKITRTTILSPDPEFNYDNIGSSIDMMNPMVVGSFATVVPYTSRIASRWTNSLNQGGFAVNRPIGRTEFWHYDGVAAESLTATFNADNPYSGGNRGMVQFNQYGQGTFYGLLTPVYGLAVDDQGNILEVDLGGGGTYDGDQGVYKDTTLTNDTFMLGAPYVFGSPNPVPFQTSREVDVAGNVMIFTGSPFTGYTLNAYNSSATSRAGGAIYAEVVNGFQKGVYSNAPAGIGFYTTSGTYGLMSYTTGSDFNTVLDVTPANTSNVSEMLELNRNNASGVGAGIRIINRINSTGSSALVTTAQGYSSGSPTSTNFEIQTKGIAVTLTSNLTVKGVDGQLQFNQYGTPGTFYDASPVWALGVDASGNVVEFTPGGGGGGTYDSNQGVYKDTTLTNDTFMLGAPSGSGGTIPFLQDREIFTGEFNLSIIGRPPFFGKNVLYVQADGFSGSNVSSIFSDTSLTLGKTYAYNTSGGLTSVGYGGYTGKGIELAQEFYSEIITGETGGPSGINESLRFVRAFGGSIGDGTSITFQASSSVDASIESYLTNASNGASLAFRTKDNLGSLIKGLELKQNSQLQLNNYTTSTAFQSSSGPSVGVLNVDNAGNVFVGTGGTSAGSILFGTATAAVTDVYTATIGTATTYTDGDAYIVRFTIGNTDAATLNINGIGAKSLYRNNDGALIGGDIWDGGEMLCIYNAVLDGFDCIGTSPNSLFAYVTNDQGSTITKGQAVYAAGGTGNRMTVKLAKADTDATSAQTIGFVFSTSIAANQKGIIIIQGYFTDLNLFPPSAGWLDGDTVYLSPTTAGAVTRTKPLAPQHLVYLGVVASTSPGMAGRMYVRVQNGYEMNELHDVASTGAVNNDILYRDTTVTPNLWKPASIPTILGYTPVPTTRSISTTSPLTGGGDLSADRTISIPAATSSVNGYLTSTDWTNFNTAYTNRITSLTTTGTSGDATLSSNTLNVPNYALNDLAQISVSTANAREDNYAPTGWPGTSDRVKIIRIDSTNTNYIMSLGGLASPTAGRVVTIVNASTANNLVIIENLSTSSTAANRFRMTNNMAYFLLPTRSVTFIYDGTYWTQMSASNAMGLDFFDDCTGAGSTYLSGFTGGIGLAGVMGSGTGSGVRAEGDSFGSYALATGSTAVGYAYLSNQTRKAGSNNAFASNSTYSYLTVGRIAITSTATALQDFQVTFGMNGSGSLGNTTTPIGYTWYYNGQANAFWDNRSQNVAGTVSTVASPLAINTSFNILGVYKPGGSNIRDAVYFYSTDGIIYQVSSVFNGTTGNYGGSPTFGIASTVGTTSKEIRMDYYGSSFNLAR